jgi:hypothetical protein
MLQSEIIYNIKNLRAGGIQSDDEDISDSQYAFIIDYYRAKIIKQDHEKAKRSNQSDVQNLGKVDLVKADAHECCDETSCVLRTAIKIPEPIEYKGKMLITYTGLMDNNPFQMTSYNRSRWDSKATFTGRLPKWYYQNGYIYIVNPPDPMIKYINIQGIFERPVEANKFRTCDCPQNELACVRGFNFDYPLDMHHVDAVVKMMADSEFRISMMIPEDTSNDSKDTNIQTNETK